MSFGCLPALVDDVHPVLGEGVTFVGVGRGHHAVLSVEHVPDRVPADPARTVL